MAEERRSGFSGQLGFVLSAAGSAVGLGNLWRFPYLAARNGGGLFLVVYAVLVATFGFALLATDIAVGRRTQCSALRAFGKIRRGWGFLGGMSLAATGLVLTVLSSLVFVIWGLVGSRAFIAMFTDDPQILADGTAYLQICQIYATGIFLATFFQRMLQATGRTVSSMLAQMAGALANLILDPIMIFGYFGCPAMGVAGAAVATVIGQWLAALAGFLLHMLTNRELSIRLRGLRLRAENVKAIYRVGAPTILTQAFGSIMIALMNLALMAFSPTAVAFFGVYFKLQNFLFMPLNGLGQGALPVVGYNLGAKKLARIEETCRTTIRFGLVLALLGAAIFMLLPGPLLSAFSASEAMKEMGIPALRTICVSFLPASVTMMIGYAISGMGNGMVNMLATAIRQCVVLVPLAWLLGQLPV